MGDADGPDYATWGAEQWGAGMRRPLSPPPSEAELEKLAGRHGLRLRRQGRWWSRLWTELVLGRRYTLSAFWEWPHSGWPPSDRGLYAPEVWDVLRIIEYRVREESNPSRT
jgi:hypothetical protein